MTPEERLLLNPIEKWQRYNKFPWKMFTHFILAILFSVLVHFWGGNESAHSRHTLMFFHDQFLGVSGSFNERELRISSDTDLKEVASKAIGNFFRLEDQKLSNYRPGKKGAGIRWEKISGETSKFPILTPDLEHDETFQSLFADLSEISFFEVFFHIDDTFRGEFWAECFSWKISAHFDLTGGGLAIGTLKYKIKLCQSEISSSSDLGPSWSLALLPLATVFFLAISAALTVRARVRSLRGVSGLSARRPLLTAGGAVSRASEETLWFGVSVFSVFVETLGALACLSVFWASEDVSLRWSLLGAGALLAWVSVLRYLRYFPSYYVLVRTLNRAIPRVARFMVGVLPVLVGYALMGAVVFWQSKFFADISGSVVSLFALLNGDVIHDIFDDLTAFSPVAGPVYLFTFLFLFVYVVLNIFLSIVEDAFSNSAPTGSREDLREMANKDNGSTRLVRPLVDAIKIQIQSLVGSPESLVEIRSFIEAHLSQIGQE